MPGTGRLVIQVVVDQLALCEVDAVLRPADASLNPVGSAATQLDGRAGARFAEQRQLATPLKAGAAVITGSGDLAAPLVLHVVIRDSESRAGRDLVRKALVSAWQRATDWELGTLASPLVGADSGDLTVEEAAALLAETFPADARGSPFALHIVVDRETDRDLIEAILRRKA